MAGSGSDFVFFQLYILPQKLPRVQKRSEGIHTLKMNHLQSWQQKPPPTHVHNPSLETNALVINRERIRQAKDMTSVCSLQ